ncbi:hypothetical protein DFH28DRAFT_1198463 [Melampsora americana]|nr:hypothetical protein DFH28DRAFT_1198463 [Melampsora americana]
MSSLSQRYRPYKRPTPSQAGLQNQKSTHHKTPSTSSHRSTTSKKGSQEREPTNNLDHEERQEREPTNNLDHEKRQEREPTNNLDHEKRSHPSEEPFNQDDLNLFNGGSDDNDDHEYHDSDGSNNISKSLSKMPSAPRTRSNNTSRATAVPSHMTGPQTQSFDRIATWADLGKNGRSLGLKLCNVTGSEEQFHACMVATLSMRQEMGILSDQLEEIKKQISQIPRGGCAWKDQDHSELKAVVRSIAVKRIMDGDVQAYTAKENKIINEDPLPFCLYGKVMTEVLGKPSEWKKEYLPPRYGKDPDNKSSRTFHSLVNTALKEVRKEFENILLQNINLPDRKTPRVDAAVPLLSAVIVKLYQKENGVSGQVLVPQEVLDKVGYLRSSRYAWVRMQAIHWGLKRNDKKFKYGKQTLWEVLDEQLEHLRTKSARYRHAFFTLCDQYDVDRIDGTKNFAQLLKDSTDFSLPTEPQIQAEIEYLNQTHGTEQSPEEAMHVHED